MNQNKETLLKLLGGRAELIPLIHDVLAEHHLSENAYASIFKLVDYEKAAEPADIISYCAPTKEWKRGKRAISDVKLFGQLDKVCDIIHLYVKVSWEECIFSAWVEDHELVKAEKTMAEMESLSHIRNILKIASEGMVYSSDGTMEWCDEAYIHDSDTN